MAGANPAIPSNEDDKMQENMQIDEEKVQNMAQRIFDMCADEEFTVFEVFVTLNLSMETLIREHEDTFASMGIHLPDEEGEEEPPAQ